MLHATSPSSAGQHTPGEDQQRALDGVADLRNDASVTSPLDESPNTKISSGGDTPTDAHANGSNASLSGGNALQRKRKAAGQTGRSVANLTPEQLAKKRANDREAQRNIRERTKAQIENLERQIEQLKSQQPYQELQRVVREKEAVEAENAELRRVLAGVLNLVRPHVAGPLDSRSAAAPAPGDHQTNNPLVIPPPIAAAASVPRAGFHHEHFMPQIDTNATPMSAASTTYSMPWQAQHVDSPASQHTQPPPFAPRPRSPNGQPTLLGMASSIYRMTDNEQEALTLLRLGEVNAEERALPATPLAAGYTPQLPDSNAATPSSSVDENLPIWMRLPQNKKATCTLDTICLTFLTEVEKRLQQGTPVNVAVGQPEPDLRFILNPDAVDAGEEHLISPLSRFFGQVLSNRMFPDLQKPPEKVGTAWLLYTSCYWQMTRRKDDYEKIPEWYRTSRIQATIPHGAWVDAMFWPKMRDAVCLSQEDYKFDDLFVPLTRTISCNWPYPDSEILDTSSGQLRLSKEFLRHISQLENWTLGPEFLQAYPKLKGTFGLRNQNQSQKQKP